MTKNALWSHVAICCVFLMGCEADQHRARRIYENLSYLDDHLESRGITVVQPPGLSASSARPAIVLYHGGAWSGGSPEELEQLGSVFASRGFVVLLPEYRAQDPVEAVRNAQLALREVSCQSDELGIDRRRILVAGASSGAHVAYFAASIPPDAEPPLAGMILLSGVVDVSENGFGWERFSHDVGQTWSPVHQPNTLLPAVLIVHGEEDDVTPFSGAEKLRTRLRAIGVECELHSLKGEGHGFYTRGTDAWLEHVLRFAEACVRRSQLGP